MDRADVWCATSCYSIQSTQLHYSTEEDSHIVSVEWEQYIEKRSSSDWDYLSLPINNKQNPLIQHSSPMPQAYIESSGIWSKFKHNTRMISCVFTYKSLLLLISTFRRILHEETDSAGNESGRLHDPITVSSYRLPSRNLSPLSTMVIFTSSLRPFSTCHSERSLHPDLVSFYHQQKLERVPWPFQKGWRTHREINGEAATLTIRRLRDITK